MSRVANGRSTRVGPGRQVESDHRAKARQRYDPGSGNERPLDPRQLGGGNTRLLRHYPQAEPMGSPGEPDLRSDPAQNLEAALVAAIRCSLVGRHRHRSWRATITASLSPTQPRICTRGNQPPRSASDPAATGATLRVVQSISRVLYLVQTSASWPAQRQVSWSLVSSHAKSGCQAQNPAPTVPIAYSR